ncbi:MAG TPA: cytochrome c oxidase assembly protein [Stellaceae bacterium]|nr:cytochrome c oxidase assembly protein [Stellaceae bacterium]
MAEPSELPPDERAARAARLRRNNLRVLGLLCLILATMTGLVSYSETFYRLFCAATGYGGTTQRVASADAKVSKRMVTVRFTTDVASGLPWHFVPAQREVKLHLGEDTLVFFDATNLSDKDYVGHATFNVTPLKAGIYFKKIQCFCFTEEHLGAHESVEMPVDFFVDPGLGSDRNTQDVDTITLSYTFFASKRPEGAKDLARFADAKPDPVGGQKIFATRCAECHALEKNVVGPALGGVVGRRAGSLASYPSYSKALQQSGIVWNAAALDKWLSGPQQDVPGALMPVRITDPRTRQDIIAYLEAESASRGKGGSATAAAAGNSAPSN